MLIASERSPIPAEDAVIFLDRVTVKYRVPRERMSGIKEFAIRFLQRRVKFEEFLALQEVSLVVRPGEVFGVIGRNGSGKSTLLKVIARVLTPTCGRVVLRGQVAPLLELGGGFHPELTGRENVYLNSALLGRSREQTNSLFSEIIEFAEIGEFIDAPIRTYSTGMIARLGFAVATCMRPQILLVDEVLSVGDAPFQQKCLDRMDSFRKQGTTIVIVTHSMGTIDTFCDRAMWLDHGRTQAVGTPAEVIQKYIHLGRPEAEPDESGQASLAPAEIARNILDCTRLESQGRLYPAEELLDVSKGAISVWTRYRSGLPHQVAILFHTDDSRYVLYSGSYYSQKTEQEIPVLIARAGGNQRVMDTYFGTTSFPEAAALVDHDGALGGLVFPRDEWHLVTMTWKGYPYGIVRLYVDDQLLSERVYDSRYSNDRPLPSSLVVGMRPPQWAGELVQKEDGTLVEAPVTDTLAVADSEIEIQEVRLYRRTLGQDELQALYALGPNSQ
jgi:lipopolysaccharide transport system ATP-binding protein